MKFEKIDPKSLNENSAKLIGSDWLLICAGTPEKYNMMTASWGAFGFMWNAPSIFVFVRPMRYTYRFMEESKGFTINVLPESRREALRVCGSVSGRDCDKTALSGLTPAPAENGGVFFEEARLVFVAGGGAPARVYQKALREIKADADTAVQDWLGIKATHLNAMLIKGVFSEYVLDDVVTDPTAEDLPFTGRILAAGGWKPGFSTDTDAVYLARRFGADRIINLSNIKKVYTADPRIDKDARPIDRISWRDFRAMVGDEWTPGKNAPFDPIASRLADESGLTVICADGRNIGNTIAILRGEEAEGTIIGA